MWPGALLLGDSQTQLSGCEGGWVQLLSDKFVRRLDIVNRGFSGQTLPISVLCSNLLLQVTTPECCSPFFRIFSARNVQQRPVTTLMLTFVQEDMSKFHIVVIFLGSNDASIPSENPQQAVPLEEFGENLLKMISLLLSKFGNNCEGSGTDDWCRE